MAHTSWDSLRKIEFKQPKTLEHSELSERQGTDRNSDAGLVSELENS
jgi:hypothetical protein